VRAVDVSPDATKIATGSEDGTLCVWSLSTGKRLLGPFAHDNWLDAVKFSPDGRLIACVTWATSVRICDSQNGRLLVEFPVRVYSFLNQTLAWASDSKQLFVLSRDSNIHCLDVSTGTTVSQWPINSSKDARCIALASNGTFIVASVKSSVSFWDTTTHEKIECLVHHTAIISCMAISSNYDLLTAGSNKITVRNLRDVLPSPYCNDRFRELEILRVREETTRLGESEESLRAQEESTNNKIAYLERTIRELRDKLVRSRNAANQQKHSLNKTIKSLRADLHTQTTSSKIANLQKTVQELCTQIAKSDQERNNLSMNIESLRSDLHARDENSNMKIANLGAIVQELELRTQLGGSHTTAD